MGRFVHGLCVYCGCQFKYTTSRRRRNELPPNAETVDHVYPVTVRIPNGLPRDAILNQVRCCNACNHRKANMHPLRWLTFIEDPIRRDEFADLLIKLGEAPRLVARALESVADGNSRIPKTG